MTLDLFLPPSPRMWLAIALFVAGVVFVCWAVLR